MDKVYIVLNLEFSQNSYSTAKVNQGACLTIDL